MPGESDAARAGNDQVLHPDYLAAGEQEYAFSLLPAIVGVLVTAAMGPLRARRDTTGGLRGNGRLPG